MIREKEKKRKQEENDVIEQVNTIFNKTKPKRGRPILYPRPSNCTHINRPEHANNVCYQCSSNINNQKKRIAHEMKKKKSMETKQKRQRQKTKELLDKLINDADRSSLLLSSSSPSMSPSVPFSTTTTSNSKSNNKKLLNSDNNNTLNEMNQRAFSQIGNITTMKHPQIFTSSSSFNTYSNNNNINNNGYNYYNDIGDDKNDINEDDDNVDDDDNDENVNVCLNKNSKNLNDNKLQGNQKEYETNEICETLLSLSNSNIVNNELYYQQTHIIKIDDELFIFNQNGTQNAIISLNVG